MLTSTLTYMETLWRKQDTIRHNPLLVSVDIMAYFGLLTGIRYHNWHLHTGSIKLLTPVSSAMHRPIYQSVLPHRILSLPEGILQNLEKGAFSVWLTATDWHGRVS